MSVVPDDVLTCTLAAPAKRSGTPFPAALRRLASPFVVAEDLEAAGPVVLEDEEAGVEDGAEEEEGVGVDGLGASTVATSLTVCGRVADVLVAKSLSPL
jgi:hypothetical protein